jgi:hypothetical protein
MYAPLVCERGWTRKCTIAINFPCSLYSGVSARGWEGAQGPPKLFPCEKLFQAEEWGNNIYGVTVKKTFCSKLVLKIQKNLPSRSISAPLSLLFGTTTPLIHLARYSLHFKTANYDVTAWVFAIEWLHLVFHYQGRREDVEVWVLFLTAKVNILSTNFPKCFTGEGCWLDEKM